MPNSYDWIAVEEIVVIGRLILRGLGVKSFVLTNNVT
jgi:hypothetical protein